MASGRKISKDGFYVAAGPRLSRRGKVYLFDIPFQQ